MVETMSAMTECEKYKEYIMMIMWLCMMKIIKSRVDWEILVMTSLKYRKGTKMHPQKPVSLPWTGKFNEDIESIISFMELKFSFYLF